jgi:hypothetical protein
MESKKNPFGFQNNKYEFKFPEVPRNYMANPEVLAYSYYLKQMNATQELRHGDFYYTQSPEKNSGMVEVYTKVGIDTYDDFNLMSGKNYVRLISESEALNLLRAVGFDFARKDPIRITNFGIVTLNMWNALFKIGLTVTATCTHSAYVKAAALGFMQVKNLDQYMHKLQTTGFIERNES